MPFEANWIEQRLTNAFQSGRLGHAYLITGRDLTVLESLFHRIAASLLGDNNPHHADLHLLRPESKSRRILIEQVRELEHSLQLKAHHAPVKVAAILAADRMCLGSAEPANAFLKTLEEPPDHSVIFLLSDTPEQLLPTIRSRCLHLPLSETGETSPSPELEQLADRWLDAWGDGADVAYRRASYVSGYWTQRRDQIEKSLKEEFKQSDEDNEKLLAAQIESQYILERDRSIAHLIKQVWHRTCEGVMPRREAELTCESFEELRMAFSRNMDQALALERCCLKISGLL